MENNPNTYASMFITNILLLAILILTLYKVIEYLVEKRSFSLVHPIKGVMNGTKPYFIVGDLPIQNFLSIKPKLKELGEIYFRWFFWYPIVEIKDINAIQYVYNEKSNNYGVYWNLNKSSNFILTGSEMKRFFRIYYCAFNCKDSLTRILPVIRDEVIKLIKSTNFQNSVLSSNKNIPNFMLKLLSRVYLGSGDEAYYCLKANYKKFNRGYLDFFHYLFPKLLRLPTKFSKKYMKNKYKRSLYQVIAMKAYYGVVKQSRDDKIEDSIINIIAETSFNDKEGLSLEEIKVPSYLLNVTSVKGPITLLQSFMFMLIENPEVESKIRKEIKIVFEKNNKTVDNFTLEDIQEMSYLEATLDEVNRLYPPFPKLAPRQSKESDRILGYHIPKGTMISCPVADILRDEKFFDNPLKFKPERQLKFSNPKYASPSITSIQQLNSLPSSSSNSFALHHKSIPSFKADRTGHLLPEPLPFDQQINLPDDSHKRTSSQTIDSPNSSFTTNHLLRHSGNRVDQIKNDPINSNPPLPKPSLSSSLNGISNNTLNIPNIKEVNNNNPISNNQYNSYNNLTTQERNERIVRNLPWGIGSKKCLGKELAKVIIKTIVIVIYSQYTFERYIEDDDISSPTEKPNIEMIFNPEIKPPLLFKSRKLVPSSTILSKQ